MHAIKLRKIETADGSKFSNASLQIWQTIVGFNFAGRGVWIRLLPSLTSHRQPHREECPSGPNR
jgi:hypothetical protein